jgi:exosortase
VWIALFVLCYGRQAFRTSIFPLSFLVLMIPVPPLIVGKLVSVLQAGSAEVTALLFKCLHVPAFREDYRFTVPHITIELAQQCSSIRSSTALFIIGLLAGHLFLRSNLQRTCLASATFLIAMFTNAVRIVTLTCLAVYFHPGFLFGGLHRSGGAAFSLLSVAIVLSLLFLLRKSEARRRRASGADGVPS